MGGFPGIKHGYTISESKEHKDGGRSSIGALLLPTEGMTSPLPLAVRSKHSQ